MDSDECSALGKKEYWDRHYERELELYDSSGDEGEIWFGRCAERCMVEFVDRNVSKDSRIVEIGCGNGSLLRKLKERGFDRLTGVDYSARAIALCEKISQQSGIEFLSADIASPELDATLCGRFEVLLDKGTWDAISLSEDASAGLENYQLSLRKMIGLDEHSPKYFVITSCNFTKDELIQRFECNSELAFHSDITASPKIGFGGSVGVTSTGVVFSMSQHR